MVHCIQSPSVSLVSRKINGEESRKQKEKSIGMEIWKWNGNLEMEILCTRVRYIKSSKDRNAYLPEFCFCKRNSAILFHIFTVYFIPIYLSLPWWAGCKSCIPTPSDQQKTECTENTADTHNKKL